MNAADPCARSTNGGDEYSRAEGSEVTMNEDELIELLRERQNNGRTGYLTFGDLVAMVPSDQMDEWRAVLAKVRAGDAARDAEEDAE